MSEDNLYGGFGADCYRTLMEILNDPTSEDYETLNGIVEEVGYDIASLRELMGLLKYDPTFDYWYDATGRTDLGGDLAELALIGSELMMETPGLEDCGWTTNILLFSTEDHGGF